MNPLSLTRSAQTPLTAAQAAGLAAIQGQKRVTDYPYYSSVCFRSLIAAGDLTYAFPAGQERRAFAYGKGQSGVAAGFTDAIDGPMTLAETNIVEANKTIGGQQVQVDGIAIMVKPAMTDGMRFVQARLLAQITTNVSIKFSINGDENTFPLGTLQQIPAAGGLVGAVNDDLAFIPTLYDKAALATNVGQPMPFGQNGWQTRGNYYRLPSGVIWSPGGSEDALLNVIFTNERSFTLYTGGTPERSQDQHAGTPINPASVGCVLTVQLIAQVVGSRTKTA
jgi:hypothetical protein